MDLQIIPNKQIERGEKLGEGGFGIVYEGTWNAYKVAIKTLRLTKLTDDLQEEFYREARIMAKLNHPAIIRLYGICKEPGAYAMLLEYMPGGDLYHLLADKKQTLPWNPLRWQIAIDIGSGLSYLHVNNILHRDLKSLNILLDGKHRAKITDFGLSKLKNQSSSIYTKNMTGSLAWMAPELFARKAKITKAADVYAYAMVLWEISARKTPFSDAVNPQLIQVWVEKGDREDIPEDCPKDYAKVIQECWGQDPEKRPPIEQALETLKAICPDKKLIIQEPLKTMQISSPKMVETSKVATVSTVDTAKEDYSEGFFRYEKCQYKDALPLFEKSAEAGYPPAYVGLYQLYSHSGRLGAQNLDIANKWRQKAREQIGWFKQRAETKAPHAQYLFAYCFVNIIDGKKQYDQVFKYYNLAAQQGHALAQYRLGQCYEYGWGIGKDFSRAVKYYILSAKQGNALGQCGMGNCYWYGYGVKKNFGQAVAWYSLGAKQGEAWSQKALGDCYWYGQGVIKNYSQAVKWYSLSAEQGNASAQYNLGQGYENGWGVPKNYSQAVKYYSLGAEQGDASAQYSLGCCYEYGQGVAMNYGQAVKYYSLSAEKGNASAQAMLGRHYQEGGLGLGKNYNQALHYNQLAAAQRSPQAQCNLGIMFLAGQGVQKNLKLGVKYIRLAAEQKYSVAQYNLGYCYEKGWGVSKSRTRAVKYCGLAADQGYAIAQNYIGVCYRDGWGVSKNQSRAVHYFSLAARQGNQQAIQSLRALGYQFP